MDAMMDEGEAAICGWAFDYKFQDYTQNWVGSTAFNDLKAPLLRNLEYFA